MFGLSFFVFCGGGAFLGLLILCLGFRVSG